MEIKNLTDAELVEALKVEIKKWMPVIQAHVEASHFLDGFNRRKNDWDEKLANTRAVLADCLMAERSDK
jgi:hypothetical protein